MSVAAAKRSGSARPLKKNSLKNCRRTTGNDPPRHRRHAYWYKHTIACGEAGCLHSGHSGFVWHHPTMHSQQKRCPQGVAAACRRLDMHKEQRRRDAGKRTASAGLVPLPGVTAGTRDNNACEYARLAREMGEIRTKRRARHFLDSLCSRVTIPGTRLATFRELARYYS